MEQLEQIIGYTFQNKKLLKQALTHSSYANEKKLGKLGCNERLEFLGDAVLELISSDFLYAKFTQVPECLTNGIFNLYEGLVNQLFLSGLHCFFEFCQIIFDRDFLNGVLFFHINKNVSTKKIAILKGLCSHIV